METREDVLVSFHGGGKLKQGTSNHDLPYAPIFPTILFWLLTKLAEVSHDLTCHWEWNHICLVVRHHPRKHCKKKKARQPSRRPSTKEKVFHPKLPSTFGPYCLQGWLSS
jgi:hypothetical protein